VATEVTEFDENLSRIVDKMTKTMFAMQGVGLAATQVGLDKRLFVIGVRQGSLVEFINPVILEKGEAAEGYEGCLSFPSVFEVITRADWVYGKAQDRTGKEFFFQSEKCPKEKAEDVYQLNDIETIAVQHELDHLDGVLLVDKVSKLKQRMIEKSVNRLMKRL
jgi:peptide deformylase